MYMSICMKYNSFSEQEKRQEMFLHINMKIKNKKMETFLNRKMHFTEVVGEERCMCLCTITLSRWITFDQHFICIT